MVFKVHAYFKQVSDIAGSHNSVAKCEEWVAEACCMGLRIVQSILYVHWECQFSYQVKLCKRRKVSSMVKFNKNVLGFQGLRFRMGEFFTGRRKMQIYVLWDTAIPSIVFVFYHSVLFVSSFSFDKYLSSYAKDGRCV